MAKIPINDPKHWRERAEEARTVADQIKDPDSKRKMLWIADDYEELARRAEKRLQKKTIVKPRPVMSADKAGVRCGARNESREMYLEREPRPSRSACGHVNVGCRPPGRAKPDFWHEPGCPYSLGTRTKARLGAAD
jgi:hypothetical protein